MAAATQHRQPNAAAHRARHAPALFDGAPAAAAPQTEAIKYAGSKRKLLPAILDLLRQTDARTVLDGFAGSTRVSQALAQRGYNVICNDVAVWSETLGVCYLLANRPPAHYRQLIDHLNAVPPQDGWFTQHYGGAANNGSAVQADGLKRPWQSHNTRKLDGIRAEIDRMRLDKTDRAVALTSLMLALDKVDSTLGHQASYLREWAPRAYGNLTLAVPRFAGGAGQHKVLRGDVFSAVATEQADAVYFDPPYGSANDKMPPSRVRYAAYYHLWTTICRNDRPELQGRARRRSDAADGAAPSVFEEFRQDADGRYIAARALEELLAQTRARWIVLSYSSGGRAAADELKAILARRGKVQCAVQVDYQKHVMAGMSWTKQWLSCAQKPNREFLFLLQT